MAITLRRGVVLSEADGQTILTSTGRDAAYYRLNKVGASCLRLLLDGHSRASTAESVAAHYDVEQIRVEEDVAQLVKSLRTAKLIEER